MLAINEAQQVKEYVNRELFNDEEIITLEDAANMQAIPATRQTKSYTILAMQYDEITIMVWVQYLYGGFRIQCAQTKTW